MSEELETAAEQPLLFLYLQCSYDSLFLPTSKLWYHVSVYTASYPTGGSREHILLGDH
jgi:hypothetical protein